MADEEGPWTKFQPTTETKTPGFLERNAQTISNLARPALEAGGAVGGGLLAGGAAAPTIAGAIPASVAGGGLGFAAGRSAADLLDRGLGLKPPIASIPEAVKETGANLQSGAAMEAGGQLIGPGVKAVGKGLLSILFGPSIKSIDARLMDPEAIKYAKPVETLARELPNDIQKLSDHVSTLHDKALDTLSTSKFLTDGAQTRDAILKTITEAKNALGRSISDASVSAKAVLNKYYGRIYKIGPTVSENELGHIVRDIDNDIDWNFKGRAPQNSALESVRTGIDGLLKTGNPDYERAMGPVADNVRLLKKAQSIFHIERDIGQGFKATNTTAAALKGAAKETRIDSQDVLEKLRDVTGRDYPTAVDNAAHAESFMGGSPNGARRTLLGGGLGYALDQMGLGGGHGSVAGLLAGATADKFGGPMAAGIIDQLTKMTPAMLNPVQKEILRRIVAASVASGASQAAQ